MNTFGKATIDGVRKYVKDIAGQAMIAVEEASTTATAAHVVNSLFRLDGKLYKATNAIAVGDTIIVGTNCVETNIDGEVIKDVQVNGTSILNNGVANVPVASENEIGVVGINKNSGIEIHKLTHNLQISTASASQVKDGIYSYRPISPSNQHSATFYGLAKAAGDSTQSQSSNAVGTYTDAAKGSIQHMLGVDTIVAPNETDPATNTHAVGDLFTLNGKLYQATGAISVGTSLVVGTNCAEVSAAGVFPHDIQMNNSSIVSNGVANIPRATDSTFGVFKVSTGLAITSAGSLYVKMATDTHVKSGTNEYNPIVPYNQHASTFYGLAKAAGDTTQSSSSNAVGTYTSEAKAAIQTMLGINHTLTVTALTQDNVTVTGQTVTVREGGPEGQVYGTASYSGQPVSFALPVGFSYYVSISNNLAHHFNPTTASGIITNTDRAVTLTYSDFSTIQTATDIKAALDMGLDLTDLVGEQITCQWNGSPLVWDVVDYSNDTITLLTHDYLQTTLIFEPPQALMWCENGLAAGSYTFKVGNTSYYFTLTSAIPSGGQLRAITNVFQTYASTEAITALETGVVSTNEINDAIDLGTAGKGLLNHFDRVKYGSNNYKESGLFQWLNSTAAANTPMPRITKFSRPCTYTLPGFLGALDNEFVSVIDDATWLCSTSDIYECPSSLGGTVAKQSTYAITAKIGLASQMEIFGSYNIFDDGSTIFDLFNEATADDRKKYQSGTSTVGPWWLRSCSAGFAYAMRFTTDVGSIGARDVETPCGVSPVVKISKTAVQE